MNNCLIEIRAGAGGDEAKIWADDLLRMYLKFAKSRGWEAKLVGSGVLRISGSKAYQTLKQEAGVHRVQRVPETERHGRIHTSTASVAVLPVVPAKEVNLNPGDLDWQFYRASTQGGQNVQKVSTAVRLTHKPSGLTVTCEQERSQEQNRKIALELLRAKIWEKQEQKRQAKLKGLRREAIGRGMRSEKIRTYNFSRNQVTDHRINKKWYNLEDVLDGNLKKIVKAFGKKKKKKN
jgi:peptide chain release factor 1